MEWLHSLLFDASLELVGDVEPSSFILTILAVTNSSFCPADCEYIYGSPGTIGKFILITNRHYYVQRFVFEKYILK